MMDFEELCERAIKAAKSAGKIINEHINKNLVVEHKEAGESRASQVVTAVDSACEKVILECLLPTCTAFNIALLTEETQDDRLRLEKEFFWCIDPLDGTLPFIKKESGFSVSISLVAKDGQPQIGVVYDPVHDILYHAIRGFGAYRNYKLWKVENTNNYLTYVTDKKLEDTPKVDEIKCLLKEHKLKLSLTRFKELAGGGAVMNAMRVAENGPALMLKLPKEEMGGGSLWDFAASACILHELGLQATNFKGGKLDLNRSENTFMNHEGVFYSNLL